MAGRGVVSQLEIPPHPSPLPFDRLRTGLQGRGSRYALPLEDVRCRFQGAAPRRFGPPPTRSQRERASCLSLVLPSPLEGEGGPEPVEGSGEGAFPLLPVHNDKVLKRLLPLHRHRLARSREIFQIRPTLQPPRKLLP